MVLNGKKISKKLLNELGKKVDKHNLNLQLDIIHIGDDKASEKFITQKKKIGESIDIKVNIHRLKSKTKEETLRAICTELSYNKNCTGYLIQLPIAKSLLKSNVLDAIDPAKDVDCLTSQNLGLAVKGINDAIRPAAVEGIVKALKETRVRLKSKKVTIINDSNLIGKPLAAYFLNHSATVTICNKSTKDLSDYTNDADIIVTATGVPHLIKKDMIKKDSVIIDTGISYKKGKIYGDADFDAIKRKAKAITPVPDGIGPLTVVYLFENLIRIHKKYQ